MFYIFNSEGLLVATSSNEPDLSDLASRNEYWAKNTESENLDLKRTVGGKFGGIWETVQTREEILAEKIAAVIKERNICLSETDWLVLRHQEQLLSVSQDLTEDEYKTVLVYRQQLRDLPNSSKFPYGIFPTKPEFLE